MIYVKGKIIWVLVWDFFCGLDLIFIGCGCLIGDIMINFIDINVKIKEK